MRYGRVVELVDSLDSGSSVHCGRAGSSPASPTKKKRHPTGCLFFFCALKGTWTDQMQHWNLCEGWFYWCRSLITSLIRLNNLLLIIAVDSICTLRFATNNVQWSPLHPHAIEETSSKVYLYLFPNQVTYSNSDCDIIYIFWFFQHSIAERPINKQINAVMTAFGSYLSTPHSKQ